MLILALILASAPPLRAIDLETAFEVIVATGPAGCSIAFDRRRFDLQAASEELRIHARERGATRAVVKAGRYTPHRCVEKVIRALRQAGVAALTTVEDRR